MTTLIKWQYSMYLITTDLIVFKKKLFSQFSQVRILGTIWQSWFFVLASQDQNQGVSKARFLSLGLGEEGASQLVQAVGRFWLPVVVGLRYLFPSRNTVIQRPLLDLCMWHIYISEPAVGVSNFSYSWNLLLPLPCLLHCMSLIPARESALFKISCYQIVTT